MWLSSFKWHFMWKTQRQNLPAAQVWSLAEEIKQLRVPTENREFPAQIRRRGRRTARAAPSTSPGPEDGFPPSQGPHSNKSPCSIMGMVNLDLSSCNTSFPARSNSK
ncbi:hypothetical protein DV515_00015910 [Chloebia gouldiae]|uniref:Uncharacterized protein n=1 Tax=Chloebia gouldiae TaxID=44316 RepID=A0A3L8RUE1_CHLGU|nr:hypothetical protein DV515_00015910 [Chloebia gouldiae]